MTKDSTPAKKSANPLKDFFMGGLSGAIAKTLCAPIERVKLLLQTQITNPEAVENPYKGIVDCFSRCIKEEGALSLWRGNLPNVLRYIPTTGINFAVKDSLQRKFVHGIDQNDKYRFFFGNLMAGGTAGAIGLSIVYPLDFCRTRLAADIKSSKKGGERKFNGLVDCIKKISASDGITGLYRGFGISILGIFIYRSLYFGFYDTGKALFFGNNKDGEKQLGMFSKFLFANAVVISSETASFPIDTVRRRLMMQSAQKVVKYTGTIDCFQKTLAEEGVTGFFKGNLSNSYRAVGSALVLVLYDEMKKYSEKH